MTGEVNNGKMPVSGQIHPSRIEPDLLRRVAFLPDNRGLCVGEGFPSKSGAPCLPCRLGIHFCLPLFKKINILGTRKGAFQHREWCVCLSTYGETLSSIISKCSGHCCIIPCFHPQHCSDSSVLKIAIHLETFAVKSRGENLMMI